MTLYELLLEYNPYHGADGRFTDESGAKTVVGISARNLSRARNVLKRTAQWDGSTTREDTRGRTVGLKRGVMVGEPKYGRVIPAFQLERMSPKELEIEVARYIAEHRPLLKKGRAVGTWRNEHGLHLDMPYAEQKLGRAIRTGRKKKEQSVFDLSTFTTWHTYTPKGSPVMPTTDDERSVARSLRVHGATPRRPTRGVKRGSPWRRRVKESADAVLWTLQEGQTAMGLARHIVSFYA